MSEHYLTPKEVSSVLRVDVHTVYRWIRQGTLGATRLGRRTLRVTRDDLAAFTEGLRSKATQSGRDRKLRDVESIDSTSRGSPSDSVQSCLADLDDIEAKAAAPAGSKRG